MVALGSCVAEPRQRGASVIYYLADMQRILACPPWWASRDRGNVKSYIPLDLRSQSWRSRALTWKSWPRCSGWHDVILQGEAWKAEGHPGARENPPTTWNPSARCCPWRTRSGPGRPLRIRRAQGRCTEQAGPLPPAKIEPPGVPNGSIAKPTPTLHGPFVHFLSIRLTSFLSPISLMYNDYPFLFLLSVI